jgi:Rrf2 family iron-sulfur cluster assembly transcriptional regulator
MRITTRGRYALRASLAMARLGKDGSTVSIRELSEHESISPVFLEQIFYKLRKAGIVDSVRGPGGGFRFARPLEELTVKAVLDAAEEGLSLAPCSGEGATCENMNDCVSYSIWAEATAMVNNYFAGMTIASLLEKYKSHFKDPTPACPD